MANNYPEDPVEKIDPDAVVSISNYLETPTVDNLTFASFIADRAEYETTGKTFTEAQYGWRNFYSDLLFSPEIDTLFERMKDQLPTKVVEDKKRNHPGFLNTAYQKHPGKALTPTMKEEETKYENGVRIDIKRRLEKEDVPPEADLEYLEWKVDQGIKPEVDPGESLKMEEILEQEM
jgi:hypothetical protein